MAEAYLAGARLSVHPSVGLWRRQHSLRRCAHAVARYERPASLASAARSITGRSLGCDAGVRQPLGEALVMDEALALRFRLLRER